MTLLSENPPEEEIPAVSCVLPLEFEEIGYPSAASAIRTTMDDLAAPANATERDVLAELEERLQSQTDQHSMELEEVRRQTRDEVRQEMLAELEEKIARERQAIIQTCERFVRERTRYFGQVEKEVVLLALAIAARVLHRETGIDPLILKSAVRVALEKVQGKETAMLRTPKEQVEEWKKILLEAHREDVSVVGDSRLQAGECVLETSVGRVDLGVKAQLEEIEKGFFDLLQQRPA
jgi:flagellar assembly protein FliH